ncbi:MAG: FtsX-like permease family protein, partial [Alistipes sp.]|nr:FtsX-like permease family protein [Alistipes sp.]
GRIYGETERLTDIYLNSAADWTMGKRNTMSFIWMLSALALAILLFAITNFINLFTAQGETRLKEIGVRKTFGAQPGNLVRQLFGEVGALVTVAFALGLGMATQLTPAFSSLIGKGIDMNQFFNPVFMASVLVLLVVTIVLSASYTSFYLSRLNPLDILGKRLRFSKSRLRFAIVGFQSAVTIVLISLVLIVNAQGRYLKDIPLGYNPRNVMSIRANGAIASSSEAVMQELLALPFVEEAAMADHIVGAGGSGQTISLLNNPEGATSINEYRFAPGLAELMRLELVEGGFFREDSPEESWEVVLNEAAVEMLGLERPVTGQQVNYKGSPANIVGVVKDFVYENPSSRIQPLVIARPFSMNYIYLRLREGTDAAQVQDAIQTTLRGFDAGFVLSPIFSEEIYESSFSTINSQGRIISVGSMLSVVLAMLGLLAIHLYSAVRRTKEIGIRRINGATRGEIFMLLSRGMLGWILIAGVVAVPVAWWLAREMFASVTNHVPLGWAMFAIPVVIQMVVALAVTSGVSIRVSSINPVNTLKSE